ncbi:hypothetical protein [Maribacter sp. 2304DJ31-5]|uniref:hypothetical protein n=1 Tax=Maribacter sp. 2304DJ31-5 TaxID=3386273 RepID=UPI0039BC6773
MKKSKAFFIRILGISLFIGFINCKERSTDQHGKNNEVVAPAQIIPIAQAESFYDNYTKRRVKLIEKYEDSINNSKTHDQKNQMIDAVKPKDSFIAARYVSYDYKTIKQYMDYVEQEAKKANVDITSLRFYFSNYPNKEKFDNGDKIRHPRQNSIMISPALEKNGNEFLFYIANLAGQQNEAVLLSDDFQDLDKGTGNTSSENKSAAYASFIPVIAKPVQHNKLSLTMNRGNGFPPQ